MRPPSSIGVVISTYNAASFLRLTLAGYAKQNIQNFSLYIADDGSGPEIKEVIDTFKANTDIPIHHVWHNDRGYRRASIINQTISIVEEPYILLTDADCVPLPNLLATHLSVAKSATFIRGSRVMFNKTLTQSLCQLDEWNPNTSFFNWVKWRLSGKINRILPLLMPIHCSKESQKLSGIRGCHFAFWRNDIININGFDASYEGWGREDSDIAARFFHAGIMRRNLYGMPVLHLWHPEASRQKLTENDAILQDCLNTKRIRAKMGIEELTPK